MKIDLRKGDCREVLKTIPDNTVDLTFTSPPYCIGKAYDTHSTIEGFREINEPVIREVFNKTKPGGSVCWQVGHFVRKGEIVPLDFVVFDIVKSLVPDAKLRNRIIWEFGHGANCRNRLSGRHETILWFTKGDNYYFDLDSIRVPQKYPGKKYYKGRKKGQYSCNPLGKNPGDVWQMPNVKAGHVEKTGHPCQFPVGLPQRLIRALCPPEGVVLDPFMGAGSAGAAAVLERRSFIGVELESEYFDIAQWRLKQALDGDLKHRDPDIPIFDPRKAGAVAKPPQYSDGGKPGESEGDKI
ncbi:site-specific DNA-methyltransferase [Guyparkeria sp. GHLCS8-2]|uniref:DNA-methyltransferase n=1 Tax=Guyparkeria halopsychrophila TaxID=3139421 RepID=UPI0037C7AACC